MKHHDRSWNAMINCLKKLFSVHVAAHSIWACSGTTSNWKGSWAFIDYKCPMLLEVREFWQPRSHKTVLFTSTEIWEYGIKIFKVRLRLPYRNDTKIAEICKLWTFCPVIQPICHLFIIWKNAFCPMLYRYIYGALGKGLFSDFEEMVY